MRVRVRLENGRMLRPRAFRVSIRVGVGVGVRVRSGRMLRPRASVGTTSMLDRSVYPP